MSDECKPKKWVRYDEGNRTNTRRSACVGDTEANGRARRKSSTGTAASILMGLSQSVGINEGPDAVSVSTMTLP